MCKSAQKFLRLTGNQKRVFLRAWWLLLVVDVGLRLTSLAKLHAWLGRGLRVTPAPAEPGKLAWDTWRLVEMASRHHLYAMNCLRRSLALQRLLAEGGLAVGVFIGARKAQGQTQAHAWIEVAGEAIGEGGGVVESFVPVLRLGEKK